MSFGRPRDERARDDEREIFGALVRPRLDATYRLAGYLLGNAAEAEDVAQEAILRAWQHFPDLRDRATFPAWLDRIVVNACRDRLRRRRIVQFRPLDTPDDVEPETADPFAASLDRELLGRALGALPPDQRIVVVLRYWKDASNEDIAAALGIPVGTVKSRLHYAFATLRRELETLSAEAEVAR